MINFIFYASPSVTLACLPPTATSAYSLEAAAQLTGVHPEMLRHYCQLGLLGNPRGDRDAIFSDEGLAAIRRIEHYRRVDGANLAALPLICGLWDEVQRLRRKLERGATAR